MSRFSDGEKLACVERELAVRRYVYAKRVREGILTRAMADREIALMAAIVEDYRDLVAGPGLFAMLEFKDDEKCSS